MSIIRALGASLVPFLIIACGPGDAKQGTVTDAGIGDAGTGGKTTAGTAGAHATGGASGTKATGGATGTSVATGGKAAGGGSSTAGNSSIAGTSSASGGSSSIGSTSTATATGGATNVAGTSSSAGANGTGGATSAGTSGTAVNTGGGTSAATGGGTATAGTTSTAGNTSAGGGTSTTPGGSKATGGSGTAAVAGAGGAATGGVAATGGSSAATGGAPATGGSQAAGGATSTCIAGLPCTTSIATCHSGKTTCNGNTTVCSDAGSATNGTSCGTDLVCHNGTCAACQAGATCTSPDSCGSATYSCDLGVPICTVTSAASPDGTACGANAFQNVTGSCLSGHCQCPTSYALDASGTCSACPAFPASSTTIYVNADSSVGQDNVCCGRTQTAGFGGPCRTITQAMQLLTQPNWTVSVTGDAAGGNVSPEETYPLHLSNGVRLVNSGAVCIPGTSGKNVINVDMDPTMPYLYSFTVGSTCQGNSMGAADGVYVGTTPSSGSTSVSLNGTVIKNVVNGVHVDGGSVTGSTAISFVSNFGVLCRSDTVTSKNSMLAGGWTISSAANADIFAGYNCATAANGYIQVNLGTNSGACPSPKQDQIGLYAESNASITLYASNIRCMNEDGITLRAASGSTTNAPSVIANAVTLQHNGCNGAYAEVGSLRIYSSNIFENHWGVVQRSSLSSATLTDALVNLAGLNNTSDVHNTFKCNGKSEPGKCCTSASCPNGGDVWNNSGLPLDATNDYWSSAPPSECLCTDAALTSCQCQPAVSAPPPDGLGVLMSPYQSSGTRVATITNYVKAPDITCPQ